MSKHVHFMGISGSGASAVAAIAKKQGWKVTGCADKDVHNEFTQGFNSTDLLEGHTPKHLNKVDILALTPAVLSWDPSNPELKMAKKKGMKILTWQHFLGKYLAKDKFIIAVCGTHGKSTTTAMVGKLLKDAGFDPIVELGAIVTEWKANFRVGSSKYLVVEADEFNNNFLSIKPDISIVTNIEWDHPEFFKDINSYKASFYKFLISTKQTIIGNLKDPNVAQILKDIMKHSNVRCIDYSKSKINFPLRLIGEYNFQNASAVYQVGLAVGINPATIQKSLSAFPGIARRFEKLGEASGAEIFTDFAHHPTEIDVTIRAIRKKFPRKNLTVIFQPHMFSRTQGLFDEFVRVFKALPSDKTYIVDIYHSREIDRGEVSSKKLVDAISKKSVEYASDWNELETKLRGVLSSKDILVFMGAGVVDQIGKNLVEGDYKDKKILILGLGLNQGGVGSAKFFAKRKAVVRVTDVKSRKELSSSINQLKGFKISYSLGGHKKSDIEWADLIIRNPAIKPENEFLKYALKMGKKVEMDFSVLTKYIPTSQIIGVTGTKGKSTTASLLYQILRRGGRKAVFAGNIGKSMLDDLPLKEDTLLILELSSFHLQECFNKGFSPRYSVITNIYPDHLNYHKGMDEYIQIKRSISAYQDQAGVTLLRKNDPYMDKLKFKKNLRGRLVYFSKDDLPKRFHPKLMGEHNLENIAASVKLAEILGIPRKKALKEAASFEGVEGRLERIYQGRVKIYNDTTSTQPQPTIEALKCFPRCILIAGGMNKGLSYTGLVKALERYPKVIYFLRGDATDQMLKSKKVRQKSMGIYDDLVLLLKDIKSHVHEGVIIFSPGATSFNLFQNEFDRGRKFNTAVKEVFG